MAFLHLFRAKPGLVLIFITCALWPTEAALPTREQIRHLAQDYFRLRPLVFDEAVASEEALAAQLLFVYQLKKRLGRQVGYKVGLVTPESQKKFNTTGPVRGVLLEQMLLENNASISAFFGVQPLCEADLLVRVRDDGINEASTPLEAAEHLSEVIAFIELPDSFFAPNHPLNATVMTAANATARWGVVGKARKIRADPGFVQALADMKVIMADQSATLGRGQGSAILGHPLNAVLWLARDLKANGSRLKPGDLLSLGTMMPAVTPRPGQRVTVIYDGLPGGPLGVSVRFK